jgi:hypothetical protein
VHLDKGRISEVLDSWDSKIIFYLISISTEVFAPNGAVIESNIAQAATFCASVQ